MEKKNKHQIKLWLEYDAKDHWRIVSLSHDLMNHYYNDDAIPTAIFKEFISYFKDVDPDFKFKAISNELIEICYKYLKSSGYDFYYKPPPKFADGSPLTPKHKALIRSKRMSWNVNYSLKKLLEHCFSELAQRDIYKRRLSKDEVIKFINQDIVLYNFKLGKKKLGKYKVYVFTGVIGSSLGIIDSKEEYSNKQKKTSGYNKFLFEQVRNSLQKSLP